MATKNLGQIKAIHIGTVAPTNITMLWYDSNVGIKAHKYYDTTSSSWKFLNGASQIILVTLTKGVNTINHTIGDKYFSVTAQKSTGEEFDVYITEKTSVHLKINSPKIYSNINLILKG